MKKSQHGFSVIEELLILVIVGIIGGTGWYVMNTNKNVDNSLNNAGLGSTAKTSKKKQTNPSPAPQADPTASWTSYSDVEGKFSLRYPSTWTKNVCSESGIGTILLGPIAERAGHCQSEDNAQISFYSQSGDNRSNYDLSSSGYDNVKRESTTISGVSGQKESGTVKAGEEATRGPGPDPGSKEVTYIFYTNGRTYTAIYIQGVSDTNVLNDFELIVTKTLKFSS